MSTIHIDNEDTVYENTEYTYSQNPETNGSSGSESTSEPKRSNVNKNSDTGRIIASIGAGVLIGGVSSFLMSMGEKPDFPKSGNEHGKDNLTHPEWVDGEIDVASSVNDNMTFDEAFAAARAEVGSGGVFEWRGQLYGTYTMAEWQQMSPGEKAEYSNHFSWNHIDNTNSVVGNHVSANNASHNNSDIHQQVMSDEQIEHELDQQIASSEPTYIDNDAYLAHTADTTVPAFDQNIEILGVSFDNEEKAPVGKMTIDGQEVILIDIDNDQQFDYMAVDVDNDGVIDTEEITPILDEHLSVDDFTGYSNLSDELADFPRNPMHDIGDFDNFSPNLDEFNELESNI